MEPWREWRGVGIGTSNTETIGSADGGTKVYCRGYPTQVPETPTNPRNGPKSVGRTTLESCARVVDEGASPFP